MSEQQPNGPKGRKPFFEQCVFLQTRVEKRVKVLLERLAGDERMKARSGTPWLGNQKQQSFGRIISVLVEEEAARLGLGVEGALLTDAQLDCGLRYSESVISGRIHTLSQRFLATTDMVMRSKIRSKLRALQKARKILSEPDAT